MSGKGGRPTTCQVQAEHLLDLVLDGPELTLGSG